MAKILIIDDDDLTCEVLSDGAESMSHKARSALSLEAGMEGAAAFNPDVIFLDVQLPDGNGLEALPKLRDISSRPEVIIITGAGSVQGAELAIKSGAWDYIQKPFSIDEFRLQLTRVLEYREKKQGQTKTLMLHRPDIIGSSPLLQLCLNQVAQCAGTDSNVMITGETGTGKELIAKTIHENSSRAAGNFVVVDCTVLPEQLVESVLFGHSRGAFTGANRSRDGLVLQADGGTLFLDEVGELPPALQKTFLRVLQERRFRMVGSTQEIPSNFRLISATNRNLEEMAGSGQFRKDLLYRLKTFSIESPPLRMRSGDIRELANHYIHRLCQMREMKTKGFSPEFMDILESYNWPGNVRELISTLEKAIFAELDSPILFPMHLPDAIRIYHASATMFRKQGRSAGPPPKPRLAERTKQPPPEFQPVQPEEDRDRGGDEPEPAEQNGISILNADSHIPGLKTFRESVLEKAERNYLRRLMKESAGDVSKACRMAGVSRARLYALLKKYDIPRFTDI